MGKGFSPALSALRVIEGLTAAEPSELKRYGGEYISALRWFTPQPPHRPPPPTNTRPSGTSTALLWYVRGSDADASVVHV